MKLIRKFQKGAIFSNTPTGRAMQRQYDKENGIAYQRVLPEVEVFPNYYDVDNNGYGNSFAIPLESRPAVFSQGELSQPYVPKTLAEQVWLNRFLEIRGLESGILNFIINPANVIPTNETIQLVDALASTSRGNPVFTTESPLLPKVINYTKKPEPNARFDLFQRPSKLSAAEKQGLPKVDRGVVRHNEPSLPYVDYSLINKHYEPWIVDETGHFILKSPEESHRLSTVHFTFNSPVTTHSGGSWEDAPTVLMLPYRNVRSQTAPVDMAIYDTFFPNYNGLKISTKGAKILTGDRPTFQYYKSKGLDVEFSPEMESLLNELKVLKTKYAQLPLEKRGAVRGQYEDVDALNDMINEISGKIDKIARNWTIQHRTPIPNYEKVNELGAAEGYDVKNYPFQFATPIRQNLYGPRVLNSEGLDYNWVSDPTNHAAALQTPEYILQDYGDELRPEYRKYIEWLINHKADYRAFGGKLIKRIRK